MRVDVVGIGGIGCRLLEILSYGFSLGDTLVLRDGDTVELKNLDRQLFSRSDVHRRKTEAMAKKLRGIVEHRGFALETIPDYLHPDLETLATDILLCCADNNAARVACLKYVDNNQARFAVIGGNETETAEAYVYFKQFKDHEIRDPRKRFLIGEDHANDPTAPCQGEAQDATPQLPVANAAAAVAMAQLFYYWLDHNPEAMDSQYMPMRFCTSGSFWNTETIGT